MTETRNVTLPTVAMLGAGSMGRAILSGLTAPGVAVEGGIRVTNRSEARAAELAKAYAEVARLRAVAHEVLDAQGETTNDEGKK